MSDSFTKTKRIGILTLEPVHIGAGRDRLGLVDNPIIKEEGTGIPKIPGTSLNGAMRHYADMYMRKVYKKPTISSGKDFKIDWKMIEEYNNKLTDEEKEKIEKKYKAEECPICQTFGFSKENSNRQGALFIKDAHITLFPVLTFEGTYWFTTKMRLERLSGKGLNIKNNEAYSFAKRSDIVAGWIKIEEIKEIDKSEKDDFKLEEKLSLIISKKIIIIPEDTLSLIIDSNLERRMSNSINPETGAAEDKALFSYESLPRNTVLVFDITLNQLSDGKETFDWAIKNAEFLNADVKEKFLYDSDGPFEIAKLSYQGLEFMGIGGMTTRGFGAVKLFELREV